MQIKCISFATKEYYNHQYRLTLSCNKFNIIPIPKKEVDIPYWLYKKYPEIMNSKKGFGYWLWKPYFILNELENSDDDTYIIYCDADVQIIKDPRELIDNANLFCCNYPDVLNKNWMKRECYELINEDILNKRQLEACVIGIKNNDNNKEFVREWFNVCSKERYISDTRYIEQLPEFKEHRHDQALLTIMVYIYKELITPIKLVKEYFDIGK